MPATDMLNRELSVGDFVVFTNNIYRVKEIPDRMATGAYVKIMLLHPSKTTRPVKKYSKHFCIIPKEDVLAWMLREGITFKD